MEVKQIAELLNTIAREELGLEEDLVAEDLGNIVDAGDTFDNRIGYERATGALVDHIGRVVLVDRPYMGRAPRVLMDSWEFGSVLEKIRIEMPKAHENETWELQDGAIYDQQQYYKPVVSAKFWNKRITFEIDMSFTTKQMKEAFSSAAQMNAFISAIRTAIENRMTLDLDALIMRTINNFTAETIEEGTSGDYETGNVRAVNLLTLYNTAFPAATTTADAALTNPDFLRFASKTIKEYQSYFGGFSTRFNMGGKENHTPAEDVRLVLLSKFEAAASVYLYDGNGQFKDENLRLPAADIVPYWQGSGDSFDFEHVSALNVKTAGGNDVEITGILGVMFDKYALGVTNMDRRVTSAVNAKAEFVNEYYKYDAGYYNDYDENFVVFYVYEDDSNKVKAKK